MERVFMNLLLTRRSPVLLFLILTCACSSDDTGDPSHRFRVFSESGVTIAENDGPPKYPGDIFRYEKELELRADPEVEGSLLLNPWQISRDRDGNIYVEDEGDMSIVMFDSEGKFQRRFGREGHGPGEFRSIGFPRVSGGILYAYDRSQNRINRFRLNGELLDVLTLPAGGAPGLMMAGTEDVIMADEDRRIIIRRLFGQGESMDHMGFDAMILDAGNDTLWSIAPTMQKSSFITSYGTSRGITRIPYGIMPSIAAHSEFGIYVSDGENPVVNRYATEGNRDLEIRFRLERETVSAEEKTAVLRKYDDDITEAEGRFKENARARREALVIADRKPYWTDVVVDDAGYIWLLQSESVAEANAVDGSLFRVVSPEGEYLGDSRWPKVIYNASISHGCVCFLVEEESGEMIPVVYRIRSNVEGLHYPQ